MKTFFKSALIILAVLFTFQGLAACSPKESTPSAPTVHPADEWTGTIYLEDTEDCLIIHSPYGEDKLRYMYIEDITYTRSLGDMGTMQDGIQNDRVSCGVFENEETDYRMHIYNGYDHYIMITCNGKLYVFNLESRDELFEWKDLITERVFE